MNQSSPMFSCLKPRLKLVIHVGPWSLACPRAFNIPPITFQEVKSVFAFKKRLTMYFLRNPDH